MDFIDVSSGGLLPDAIPPAAPGYQVPFAAAIKKRVGIATGAVGLITQARQAQDIVAKHRADAVLLGKVRGAHPGFKYPNRRVRIAHRSRCRDIPRRFRITRQNPMPTIAEISKSVPCAGMVRCAVRTLPGFATPTGTFEVRADAQNASNPVRNVLWFGEHGSPHKT